MGRAKLPDPVPASGPSSNMKNRKLGILFIVRMVEIPYCWIFDGTGNE